jgi:hypothetical protein
MILIFFGCVALIMCINTNMASKSSARSTQMLKRYSWKKDGNLIALENWKGFKNGKRS